QNFTLNNTASGGTVQLGAGTDLNITGNWTTTAGAFDAQTNARTVTFNGAAAQTITGTTDFYNLTINNAAGVTLASGTLGIRNTPGSGGTLTLQNGILNIGTNPLIIRNTDAVGVIGGTPSASAMISTDGTTASAGVTKIYGGAQSFTFPIGTASPFPIYTPATINVTNLGTGGPGSITVAPVRAAHPQATTATGRILYYWRTTQSGFAEESAGFSVTHTYTATTAVGNLGGTLANYVGAYFVGSPAFQWNFLPVPPNTPNPATFDEGTFTIGAPTPGTTNRITGDFTAGEGLVNPTVYYSFRNGNWDAVTGVGTTTWSTDPVTEIPPGTLPNAGNPVVIRNGHVVNTNGSGRLCASLTFQSASGGTLVISNASSGHNFGTINSVGGAPGTIRFDQNAATPPVFPTATLDPSFLATGTIEYSGTGSYTLPTTGVPNPYPNLVFSGSGTKTLPAGATNVALNLTLGGTVTVAMGTNTMNRTSLGGTMTMGANTTLTLTGANNFPANYGTYSLNATSTVDYAAGTSQTVAAVTYGNLTFSGGGTNNRTLAGATTVQGNLTIGAGKTLVTSNNDLTVGGNFNLAAATSGFTGGTSTVTFNGAGAQTITRTDGGTLTFNNMTVNKPSGALTLATAAATTTLSVPGTLAMTSGTFAIGGSSTVPNVLSLGGTVTGSGTITGSTFSDLAITGSGALGTLNFTTGAQTLRRLSVNRTGSTPTVTLGTELSVGGSATNDTLTLTSGRIVTGTNALRLTNVNQVGHGSATAYVDGILSITYPSGTGVNRFFPIGSGAIYRPMRVIGNPATGTRVEVQMINSPPPGTGESGINNLSQVRYYRITTNNSFGSPSVMLSLNTNGPADEPYTNTSGLRLASTNANPPNSSTIWNVSGASTVSGTFPSVTIQAALNASTNLNNTTAHVTAASVTPDNPLPVNMLAFNLAAKNGRTIRLTWETASEQDNLGFVLYRSESENGVFEEIASYQTTDKLRGQGTKLTETKYVYEDSRNTQPGKEYFYKLVSVDYDGARHNIEVGGQSVWSVQLPFEYALDQNYPNPFNPVTTIQFSLEKAGRTTLEIYNALGQKVATLVDGDLNAGAHRYQWNASGLSSGIYFYRLRSGNFVATKKMLLVR
ncbi:MAG: T9SS type A sorting domain-containing protein, partial [Chloroherpetonaceae bacterium]|nr:T9SS type A sorting domain-containing protein [Chloroherpetonaceae bacterium]